MPTLDSRLKKKKILFEINVEMKKVNRQSSKGDRFVFQVKSSQYLQAIYIMNVAFLPCSYYKPSMFRLMGS